MVHNYIPSTEKVAVENYPYGFRLRTTLYDWLEFNPKHGFRHCTQTVNPKNGRLNAPKKSTYYTVMLRYYNEEGHIKSWASMLSGDEELNNGSKMLAEFFLMFTEAEIKHIYERMFLGSYVSMKATCAYGGSKFEDVKPLYQAFIDAAKEGMTTGANVFAKMQLDCAAIDATKPADYQPFRTTVSIPLSSLVQH